jgi:hypothetical protein
MHFSFSKILKKLTTGCCLVTFVTGCGLLGSKNAPTAGSGEVGGTGCLNHSKDLVSRYVAGSMTQKEWKTSFDCIDTSLKFFTEYVRGSAADSYTQNDMYNLISKFLITNKPVKPELMAGAFSLKSALFGGSSTEFTKDEVELLKISLGRLRDLIPYLQLRQQANPTYEQLSDLVVAFQRAGDQLADYMNTLPTEMLSDAAVASLIKNLQVSLDLPVVDDLSQTIFLAKWLMFNTRRDAFEPTDWPLVMKTAMGLGGIMLAYKASIGSDVNDPHHNVSNRFQNDYKFREFVWTLAVTAKPYLLDVLTRHGGVTPFPLFDHLIDTLPADMLDNLPKNMLKQTIRPIFTKLLISKTGIGVDAGVINTVYSLMGETVADLGALDRFYEKTGLDTMETQPAVLQAALNNYQASLTGADQIRFAIINTKIMTYTPQLYRDTGRIRYALGIGYSKQQHMAVLAFDRIGRHLIKTYGSGPDYFVDDDLAYFFSQAQYQDLLFALKLVDPTVANFGPKRRQDMDLFTPNGNGDGKASITEIVNYALTVVSASSMGSQMRREITSACDVGLGQDLMGWTRLPADCFRRQFNQRLSYWIDSFPRLQKYWNNLSPDEQTKAMIWLEHGSRRNGYSNVEFDKFDIGAMATVLHYTENLFVRFDADNSEVLSKSEIMSRMVTNPDGSQEDASAYPVFKLLLAKKAKMSSSNDYLLKGIFAYIVKYRAMPVTSGIGNLAKLGWWLAIYTLPTTNYSADRLGVFNIVCQLSAPESQTQIDATPSICSN